MSGRTKGPWICPGTDGGDFVICNAKGKRRTIAHAYSKADAEFIVRAVKGADFTPYEFLWFTPLHGGRRRLVAIAELTHMACADVWTFAGIGILE